MAKRKTGNMIAGMGVEADWQTQRDLDTLMECERIEKDPKRLAAAQKLAKQKLLDLASVASEGKDD